MSASRALVVIVAALMASEPALADTLNSFRHAHGLAVLHRSKALQAMAQQHARSMAARRSMDHEGFLSSRGPRGARAENVAWGCASESCAMKEWEQSAGHRANMLRADVKSYGLASAGSGRGRYWALVLGR